MHGEMKPNPRPRRKGEFHRLAQQREEQAHPRRKRGIHEKPHASTR